MATPKQNFIYAYDDETHQIIIIDAETGEQIQKKDDRVLPILHHFNEEGNVIGLRKFSIWCAQACNAHIKPIQKKFLEMAGKAIRQETDQNQLATLYEESEGEAIAVDTVGLRQGSSKAPGFLASRECINPHAFEGARNAARYHCLWAEFQQKNHNEKVPDGLMAFLPDSAGNIVEQTEQAQVDYLLDLLNE